MEEAEKIQQKLPNQEFDYFKLVKILLSRWYWIAAAVLVCYVIANIYIWYTPKTYSATSTIKLEEKKQDLSDVLGDMVNEENSVSRIQSEIYILESRSLISNAARDLNYPVSFFLQGRVNSRTKELYPQKPLDVKILRLDTVNYYSGVIACKQISDNSYELTFKLNGKDIDETHVYGRPVNIDSTIFIINKPEGRKPTYLLRFNSPGALFDRVRGRLEVSEVVKNSGIIELRQSGANPQFASDILNAIMREYLVYDRSQKRRSASQMINFIDKQLDTIEQKVQGSANAVEAYKQKSKLMDVNSAAQTQITKAATIEAQLDILKVQANAINQLKQQVAANKDNTELTFNTDEITGSGPSLLVNGYNSLVKEKAQMAATYIASSKPIKDLDHKIDVMKSALANNIAIMQQRIDQKIANVNDQLTEANKHIADFPVEQRELASLDREFDINNKVYTLLSEKRLDAQVSRSGIASGASIIEMAEPDFSPVSPDEHDIKRTAIFLGIFIGLGLIVMIRVLNPYIYDKETIESLTSIPIIGVIRKFAHKRDEDSNDILVLSQPKSVFAESVRSVRTNLSFLASEKQTKVICITSEVAGEGKSFVAVNLSSTLSMIDKKIILVAADLRRSKLHKTFHVPNDVGLSNYLANQASIDDIIIHTNQNNFDFIPSGPVPPNPSELLHTDRMKALIDELKDRYDFIMIDTAPVGLVSDSIPLVRMSDINVFVIRAGSSKYYAATIPQRIDQEYNLNNSVIILNAFEEDLLHSRYYVTKFTGDSHGTRYYYYSDYVGYESSGYYIDSNKKRWWDIRNWFK